MPITALPTPPSRTDSANFSERADAFMSALPTFATEANALQQDVNEKQIAVTVDAEFAEQKAEAAGDAADIAVASRNAAASAAGDAVAAKLAAQDSEEAASNSEAAAAASLAAMGKDASNGTAGLTLLKINFKNVLNTFTSFFTNANTAARTYMFPDKSMTVAGLDDPAPQIANKFDSPVQNRSDILRVIYPEAAYLSFGNDATGAVKIALPAAMLNMTCMLRFRIEIFSYGAKKSETIYVSYYYDGPNPAASLNASVQILGSDSSVDLSIRVGKDATNPCLWIGDLTSLWGFTRIHVAEVLATYFTGNESTALIQSGWSMSLATAFDTVTHTVTDNLVYASATSVKAANLPGVITNNIKLNNAPSADANTLDRYEEGTYTPALYGTTTPGTHTYSNASGSYQIVGNWCHVTFRVQITAIDPTMAGDFRISLPLVVGGSAHSGAVFGTAGGINLSAGGQLAAAVFNGIAAMNLVERTNVGQAFISSVAKLGVGVNLRGNISFLI